MNRIRTLASFTMLFLLVGPHTSIAEPRLITELNHFYSRLNNMIVSQNYVAVSTTGGGLQILDYQDPANPQYLSGIYLDPGYLMPTQSGVAVLYQSILDNLRVAVVDLTDPVTPNLHDFQNVGFGELWTWSSSNNLLFTFSHIDGDGIYVPSVEQFTLTVLNNQGRPEIAYSETAENYSFSAYSLLSAERLLFHNWSKGFVIYDITNPFQPEIILESEIPYLPCFISANNRYAVVINQRDFHEEIYKLLIVDCVGEEGIPPLTVITEIELNARMQWKQLDDDRLLVKVGNLNTIYDLSNPVEPAVEARFELDGDIYPIGNNIWSLDPSGIDLYDGRNLDQLELISRYSHAGRTAEISKNGERLVSANEQGGFDIFSLRDPADPERIASFPIPAKKVSLQENRAYVVTNDSSIVLYDLTDPANPDSQSCIMYHDNRFGFIIQIESYQDYLFVLDAWGYSQPIQIYDFHDPHNPQRISELRIDGEPVRYSFHIEGSRLITFYHPGDTLQAYTEWDISDPSHPTLISTFPIARLTGRYPQGLNGFAVDGDYLHLLIRTLIHPRQSPHDYQDTAMYVYRLYDVSNQNEPQLLDTMVYIPINLEEYESPFVPQLMAANGINAIICRDKLGSIDIIEGWRNSSRRKAGFDTRQPVNDILTDGQYLYIANGRSICVWDLENLLPVEKEETCLLTPGNSILSAFPNPFNSSTTISYTLPKPGKYAIDVVDIQGRLVTRLSDGWREAGSYREVWEGGVLTSGQYLIKLIESGQIITQQIVLIK